MSLSAGVRLGHFTITAALGAGGMGEVYRGRDERLERDVAIKVLPAEVAGDHERLARFGLEAKALARLSHPNILAIHEFGVDRGVTYAVTELLEGETLRGLLGRGALPWRRAVEIAAAVADGLAAAHAQGIVHRDLKPENVFITDDGWVKVLDFGLARLVVPTETMPEVSSAPTEAPSTAVGTILGTVGYMAPEQVRGEATDARSDIFALGCVLHEMLAGRRPFEGSSAVEAMAAVLQGRPPSLAEQVRPALPDDLVRVAERCLEASPVARFQSAADLAFALRATMSGADRGQPTRPTAPHTRPSVAVLPFANLSADPEQEYFCDGMAEEIINALAHLEGLRVIARTSSFAFKGRHEDVRGIGGQLDVGTVLEGSVRRAGDRLRITAQLINVQDGSHLWSERFDRQLEDVFAIQDEIALAIVDKLEVQLLGRERTAVVRRGTENMDAYNAYLKAWFHWNELTPEGYRRSRQCLEEAIAIDPGYARAHAGLAVWYGSQALWGELSPEEAINSAVPLAEKALRLDETVAEAHGFMGFLRGFFERDWAAGEAILRRAALLAPNNVEAHAQLGVLLLVTGRFHEALAEVRLAGKLDPLSPTWSSWTYSWVGFAGELDEGIAGLEMVVTLHPHHWTPHHDLATLYALAGRLEEARTESETAMRLSGGTSPTMTQLALHCYLSGHRDRGDELFEKLLQRAHATYVPPTLLAWVHLARGETDQALGRLQQAAHGKDPWIVFHRFIAPQFRIVDPRIDALLADVLP